MRTLIAALIFLPVLAHAEGLPSITGDFTGDGIADRADLTPRDYYGMAGLEIYVGQPDGTMALTVTAPSLVWMGGIGQQPDLSITTTGALQLVSMNEAIGRNRWHQTLTIVADGDAFRLAGFAYDWYDTLDLAAQGACAVDLTTGQGLLTQGQAQSETRFQTAADSPEIQNWKPTIPTECALN